MDENKKDKVKRDTRNERIISLTQSELNDIVYYASLRAAKKALDNHYNGLIPWFDLFERDHAALLTELEQIKLRLDNKEDVGTKPKKVKPDMIDEMIEQERKARKYKKYEDEE